MGRPRKTADNALRVSLNLYILLDLVEQLESVDDKNKLIEKLLLEYFSKNIKKD